MSYYPVLNMPRRAALGEGICAGLTSESGKASILTSQALWGQVKSWKTALDTNQQPLLGVFNQADATEFADLYTYVVANEAGIAAALARFSEPWGMNNPAGMCATAAENALIVDWGTKVSRLKALMNKATGQTEPTGTGQKVIVIYPGQQGQSPQAQVPAAGSAPTTAATDAAAAQTDATATAAKNKELTKNLLIGGGILAAIGTGIWALVRK